MNARAAILRPLLEALLATLRVRERGADVVDGLLAAGSPFVLAFWHGSMLYPWWRFRRRGATALVSRSRDGGLLAGVLAPWGYAVVRGSSSSGGHEAMEQMRAALAAGSALFVTPDGPRGPRGAMKMGAVRAAQTAGVPLVLAAVGYRRAKRLRSWDAFEVPLPFTLARAAYSDPIVVDPRLAGAALDDARADVERRLRVLDADARGADW